MGITTLGKKITKILPDFGLSHLIRPEPINTYDPTRSDVEHREEVSESQYTVINYNEHYIEEVQFTDVKRTYDYYHNGKQTWINVDGLRKEEVYSICDYYGIHHLVADDILSVGQRAKMDEIDKDIFCLLPMIYYNPNTGLVEQEQVSIVFGKDFLISFQEDPLRDVFDSVRKKLRTNHIKLRSAQSDYLLYSLLDAVVDSYFQVMMQLEDRIETLEEQLLRHKNKMGLAQISVLRRELMIFLRLILPVKEMTNNLVRSEHPLLTEHNEKYFKDVLDHAIQATDHAENLRDMLLNLQDLIMSQINLRMNETMRMFTIITTLLAPATVIGGIFGMNFEIIPMIHHQAGFYLAVALMLVIPLFMLVWFKRKGWF